MHHVLVYIMSICVSVCVQCCGEERVVVVSA